MLNDFIGNKNKLIVNCGIACLLRDSEGALDKYDSMIFNCGTMITSSEISAKLAGKSAIINCGDRSTMDIMGEIVRLGGDRHLDYAADMTGKFIVAEGNVILHPAAAQLVETAEGILVGGTLYYPESMAAQVTGVIGDKRKYSDGAKVIIGAWSLKQLLDETGDNYTEVYLSGTVTEYEPAEFERAAGRGLHIHCGGLNTYESLNEKYGGLFSAGDRGLVPDGYTIVGLDKLTESDAIIYGPRIYAKGNLIIDEREAAAFDHLESVIVEGEVRLSKSLTKKFKELGKAKSYFFYEGVLRTVSGFEMLSHDALDAIAKEGGKLTIKVEGALLFDKDVTAEDIAVIDSLQYSGAIFAYGTAKGALSLRVGRGDGFFGDIDSIKDLTGLGIDEIMGLITGGGDKGGSVVNTGCYILS